MPDVYSTREYRVALADLTAQLTAARATIARLEGEKAALQTEQQGVVSWSESACDICGKTTMIIGKKLETEP